RRAASPELGPDPRHVGRECRDPAGTCTPGALCSDARPSHPSDYQSPCPDVVLERVAKLLNYRGLILVPCRNAAGGCSGLLQKGWQLVANDCRARFLTGRALGRSGRGPKGSIGPCSGRSGAAPPGSTWSAAARTRAGAPPPHRKRSPPCAWRPDPAPPSATASAGT